MIHRVGIIGGGLAGLYAAWALEQAGVEDDVPVDPQHAARDVEEDKA